MTRQFRGAVTIAAALLVIVVTVSLVIGQGLWRDWTGFQAQQARKAQLVSLETRTWLPSRVEPGAACPVGPYTYLPPDAPGGSRPLVGTRPVHAQATSLYVSYTRWGTWMTTYYLADPGTSSLMVVRARDLVTGQPVLFAEGPFEDNADNDGFPTGVAVVTDSVFEQPVHGFSELLIDPSRRAAAHAKADYLAVTFMVGYPKDGSGCIGFRVDGSGFTETFVVGYG